MSQQQRMCCHIMVVYDSRYCLLRYLLHSSDSRLLRVGVLVVATIVLCILLIRLYSTYLLPTISVKLVQILGARVLVQIYAGYKQKISCTWRVTTTRELSNEMTKIGLRTVARMAVTP